MHNLLHRNMQLSVRSLSKICSFLQKLPVNVKTAKQTNRQTDRHATETQCI